MLSDWLRNHKALLEFQTGFIKAKRTMDNIFIIKTMIGKYLRVKRGHIYWCFIDLEKAFDAIDGEALWFRMRREGISEKMMNVLRSYIVVLNFLWSMERVPEPRSVQYVCMYMIL